MSYLYSFSIIIFFTVLGELCHYLLPIPIPASIYGLFFLFLALLKKWVVLEKVEKTGDFLISIMPILFVPPLVGLMEKWEVISSLWGVFLFMVVISTAFVMVITGLFTKFLLAKEDRL